MKEDTKDQKIAWLQYINTGLLTLILGFATMIWISVNNVRSNQSILSEKIATIKLQQDINTKGISDLFVRVTLLESSKIKELEEWVDKNYIRKPQK